MLDKKPEPTGLLKAYYSEERNDVCLKHTPEAMISLCVTTNAHIVAVTEIKKGNAMPLFSVSKDGKASSPVGEVYERKAKIGNYSADAEGLIGRIHIRDFRYLMERDLMDNAEEMLALYNPINETKAEQDLAERVEKLKSYMGDFLKPADYIPTENKYVAQKEDIVTPGKKDDGAIPIPESWKETFAILAQNNRPSS